MGFKKLYILLTSINISSSKFEFVIISILVYVRVCVKQKITDIKMDNSQRAAHQAGQAKGQAQEKASNLMDSAGNAAQSAKESAQNAGQQLQEKAQGAAESVKNAVGANR